MLAVGLVRSEASAERLRQAGGEPLTGTVDDLDVLARGAAAGEKLSFPVSAWMLDSSCSGPALDRTQHAAGDMMTLPSLTQQYSFG